MLLVILLVNMTNNRFTNTCALLSSIEPLYLHVLVIERYKGLLNLKDQTLKALIVPFHAYRCHFCNNAPIQDFF